jgi:hypothetical protein
MNRPTLLFACIVASLISHSQTKMVIDRIQCTSSYTNVFDYLNYPEAKKKVYTAIKDNAAALWNANLYENEIYTDYDVKKKVGGTIANRKLNTAIVQPTVDGLHLFIGINENPVFASREDGHDSLLFSLLKKGHCVIDFQAVITDNNGNIQLDRKSSFIIQNNNPRSYGYVNRQYSISPSSLVELTNLATRILLDTRKKVLDFYAVTCSQAYFSDNFIMPATVGRKRTFMEAKKDFVSFKSNDSAQHLLRFPNMNLYLMDLKKKKGQAFTLQEQAAIDHKKNNSGFKYCNMQHEFRNVLDNRSYTSNIAVSMNENNAQVTMDFLPRQINYMVSGKDTVATFSIGTGFRDNNKKIQLSKLYNGIDTSFQLSTGSLVSEQTMVYNTSFNGMLLGKPFQMFFSNGNTLTEVFYNNQLVCIAKGGNLPESFVLIDANLPKDILHPLLMLAFIKL